LTERSNPELATCGLSFSAISWTLMLGFLAISSLAACRILPDRKGEATPAAEKDLAVRV
jgi:hypothetical protein